jgi:hypothetical protein
VGIIVITDRENSSPFNVVVGKGWLEECCLFDKWFSLYFIYVPQSSDLQAEYLIAKQGDLHFPPSFTLISYSA